MWRAIHRPVRGRLFGPLGNTITLDYAKALAVTARDMPFRRGSTIRQVAVGGPFLGISFTGCWGGTRSQRRLRSTRCTGPKRAHDLTSRMPERTGTDQWERWGSNPLERPGPEPRRLGMVSPEPMNDPTEIFEASQSASAGRYSRGASDQRATSLPSAHKCSCIGTIDIGRAQNALGRFSTCC
jgi:hypothetical protein